MATSVIGFTLSLTSVVRYSELQNHRSCVATCAYESTYLLAERTASFSRVTVILKTFLNKLSFHFKVDSTYKFCSYK